MNTQINTQLKTRFVKLSLFALALTACQPAVQLIPLQTETLKPAVENLIDVSQGQALNQGGRLSVHIRYDSSFKTQILPCTINTHLQSYRVFLLNGNPSFGVSAPFGLLNDISSRVVGSWYGINKNGLNSPAGTQTITFQNVPSGQYYVAFAAFSGTAGSGSNITSLTALLSNGSIVGTGAVTVTDSGGEAGAPGRVNIGPAPDFPIQNGSSAPLGATLRLAAIGCL